jgi:hypothetical protein
LVSVHALEEEMVEEMRWVRKDVHSLADRVLFLGWPHSFALDAFGCHGGYAYSSTIKIRRPLVSRTTCSDTTSLISMTSPISISLNGCLEDGITASAFGSSPSPPWLQCR